MADYSAILRLALQEYGENPDAWGAVLNSMLERIGESISMIEVAVAADVTLTVENGLADQSRRLGLTFTGAGGFVVTHAATNKPYLVVNNCTADVTLKPAAGTGATIRAGFRGWYCTNEAGTVGYALDTTLDKIAKPVASVDMNSQKLVTMAKGTSATDGATLSNTVSEFAAPSTPLDMNGQKVSDVGAPVDATDAATKGYIDTIASSGNLATVAGIAAQITTVAGIDGEIVTVAGIAGDVTTVAGNNANVTLVADNMADILNASQLLDDLTSIGLVRDARTSNTQLVKVDRAKLIEITSGTFSQTFAAVAALEANWWCYISNSGTGDITLDPDGSETIDGLTSFVMYPGEVRLVQCDGAALRSRVFKPFSKTFTASDNFVKPPGYKQIGGVIRGGGHSGERRASGNATRGGGGGGSFPFVVDTDFLSATEAVVVGAGGAAVLVNDAEGNIGGDSSFAGIAVTTSIAARGGAIFGASASALTVAADFTPSRPDVSNSIAVYGGGSSASNITTTQGSSLYGGGCGGSITAANVIAPPGTSQFAGGGGAASTTGAGTDGTVPSGGGGASRNGFASGAGARGEVQIYGVA